MVLTLVIAGFFGTIISQVLDRVGKDPATDALGFFIFPGLAKLVLV